MSSSSMIVLCSAAALALLGMTLGAPQGAYQFSAGVDEILDELPVRETFDCTGRRYGYYADTDNNCQIFHICMPVEDDSGAIIETMQWSFVCGNQTVFDQQTLACSHPDDALPCDVAEDFYSVNEEFGKKEK